MTILDNLQIEFGTVSYQYWDVQIGQLTFVSGRSPTVTPSVSYGYTLTNNASRLSTMTYSDGRVLHDGYNAGIGDAISRVRFLADDMGKLQKRPRRLTHGWKCLHCCQKVNVCR